MRFHTTFLMPPRSVAAFGVHAQDAVLKGSQVTESALIDALTIEGPQAASGATRGFRPSTRPPADGKSARSRSAGKANLLITFATDSSELTGDSQASLDALARALQSDALAGFSFRVEGHSDARGDACAQPRAVAAARRVGRRLPRESARHPARAPHGVGKGSSEPLNTARIDAPENRRVTIVTTR